MAILVVAIHTEPFANCTNSIVKTLYDCVVQCAVPYFFISSGFLLMTRIQRATSESEALYAVRHHLQKILKMYLLWSAIYAPLAIYGLWDIGYSVVKGTIIYLRNFFLVGAHYNSWMLWYLLSTIYALLFVGLLMKYRTKLTHITVFGGIIFVIASFISALVNYTGMLPAFLSLLRTVIIKTIVNGRIFTGFLYIPLGMLLAKKQLPFGLGVLFFSLGFVGNFLFNDILGDLFLVLCSVGVFTFISQIKLPDSKIYPVLRSASTAIYLIHMYVWTAYYTAVYRQKTFGLDSFFITVCVSLAIALLWHCLSRKKASKCKS